MTHEELLQLNNRIVQRVELMRAGTYINVTEFSADVYAVLEHLAQRPTSAWVAVSVEMPQPGVTVLASYQNRCGKGRRVRAVWIPAKFEEASPEQENVEYDEAKDAYFTPEGWYEQIDNWDDYTAVAICEGDVTHWMPMPPAPDAAAPSPQAAPAAEGEQTRLHDIVPPSAAEWFAGCPGIASHDWRGGWDACRNRCRTLLDETLAVSPTPAAPAVPEGVSDDFAAKEQAEYERIAALASGVPAFDPTQPCQLAQIRNGWKPGWGGVPTMCPRCKNPHHACDGGGTAPTDGGQQ